MFLPIFSVERKNDPGTFANGLINALQAMQYAVKRDSLEKREVEVFREAVVDEIAPLQGGSAFEGKARSQIRFLQGSEEPSQAVVAFEHVLSDPTAALLCETVRQHRDISLWYHLGRSDCLEFLRGDIQLQTPARHMRALHWQGRIEPSISLCENVVQPFQLGLRPDSVQIKQVTQAAGDGAHPEPQGIIYQLRRLHVPVTHPKCLGDICHAATVLRLPQAVNYRPLKIADVYTFLLRHPVLCRPKELGPLDQHEPEFGSLEGTSRYSLGA